MKKEDLKKIISQIKKYKLISEFKDSEEFENWLSKLNSKQIQNFNNLNIDVNEIKFPRNLLINRDLLNCEDYTKRIEAMSKLKNGDGCWYLFDKLCSPNFLNSKNYYKDMEMISKAATARYALLVISKDTFINSKYHDEDLKLIIEAIDTMKEGETPKDWLVAESLASVASNANSINSKYHRQDMELIATSGSECLQLKGSYPETSINNLAKNKVSLKDIYHLENMQILSKNPVSSKYLYAIMTDPNIVAGKTYREEVEILASAKSEITARAMYYYIVNPNKNDSVDSSNIDTFYDDFTDREASIKGNLNPRYLEYLKLLNEIDDKFVMYFESLLSNKYLFESAYQEYDLNLMLSITDEVMYKDLYALLLDSNFISSPYHIEDLTIISQITNEEQRDYLIDLATNEHNIKSQNHRYDMQYTAKLDFNSLTERQFSVLQFLTFHIEGIETETHIEWLEKISKGEIPEGKAVIRIRNEYYRKSAKHLTEEYFDNLEKQLDADIYPESLNITIKESNVKTLARILNKKRFIKK